MPQGILGESHRVGAITLSLIDLNIAVGCKAKLHESI